MSQFSSNFISQATGYYGQLASTGVLAPSFLYDFTSSYNTFTQACPNTLLGPDLWLGGDMSNLIASKKYNVFVDCQYSIYLSTSYDSCTWISTVGIFNARTGQNVGRTVVSRVGNQNYMEVYNKYMFNPKFTADDDNLPSNSSNFHLELDFLSTNKLVNVSSILAPAYDIFIPGQNNFTFTLVPVTSTIIDSA